jgi:hypothetical protein
MRLEDAVECQASWRKRYFDAQQERQAAEMESRWSVYLFRTPVAVRLAFGHA